ncbi:MAG: hypothetical protein ACD_3C00073G0009, partial [uncultured bacterium (gcode 4)]
MPLKQEPEACIPCKRQQCPLECLTLWERLKLQWKPALAEFPEK